MKIAFIIAHKRNNVVVSFETLKLQSFMFTKVRDCDLLIVVTFSTFLHVYCALVDLGSSGSPGVRPTPGLTSSTQVVCVCVRAYTSTHTHPPP